MPAWSRNRVLLLGFLCILLAPAGFLPLVETTEARYAEIAREMVASGNYLEPTLNGIKHFHKPPLAYWLIAAGLKLFGINDFGARFFGIVAAAVALMALYRLALLILADREQALAATMIGASSLLFLAVSRIVSTDIYLACFTLLALHALFRQIHSTRSHANALLYALWLGLGFLTKGPIIFLFTLFPCLVAKIFDRQHRRIFSKQQILVGTLVFLAIVLPWFLAVGFRNPGLLAYFVEVQTIDRAVSDRFHRYQPPWYFLTVFFGTFLPYALFFLAGALRPRDLRPNTRILLLYVLLPFLIFSLASSKQATYILPLFGAASIVAAEVLLHRQLPRLKAFALAVLLPVALAPALAALIWPPLAVHRLLVGFFSLPAVLAWAGAVRHRRGSGFLPSTAVLLILVASAVHLAMATADTQFRGYERMAETINHLDPQRQSAVVAFRSFLPSIAFYRGQLLAVAQGRERETLFQDNASYREILIADPDEVRDFFRDRGQVFVVMEPESLQALLDLAPLCQCREIFTQRKHSAYLCGNLPPPPTATLTP